MLLEGCGWNRQWLLSRLMLRYVASAFVCLLLVANFVLWHDSRLWDSHAFSRDLNHKHPIRELMREANIRHEGALAQQSLSLETAASRYRERRGRHPPPGFDPWFKPAIESDAVVVEHYFDRIYKDLTPFWTLDPDTLKKLATASEWRIKVRNGTASEFGDAYDRVPWLRLWTDLVSEFAKHLPDLDVPINYMDESRLLVPYATIAKFVEQEAKERTIPNPKDVVSKYKGHLDIESIAHEQYEPSWYGPGEQFWDILVKTCPPGTLAYGTTQLQDLSGPAEFPQDYRPSYAYHGYIRNFTASMDPCLQPHLRQLHGSFIEPISLSSTEELIPLFGGSKLPNNNEILIPGAMYLTKDELYSGGDSKGPLWERKKAGAVWRGEDSGGRARSHNWQHFQRQRLVHMLNGSVVSEVEKTGNRALTFEMPSQAVYPSERLHNGKLGPWSKSFVDAAFTRQGSPEERLSYNGSFTVADHLPMKEQYKYKFLPDVDGNSFSARFRSFLGSTSLPLKATIYAEWHDDRLVPWLHFVPFDNTFQDLYPILDFFDDDDGPGDKYARFIAEQGQSWSDKVLQRGDMALYMWRLLLEWARVCDENRRNLGYVDDLNTQKPQSRGWMT